MIIVDMTAELDLDFDSDFYFVAIKKRLTLFSLSLCSVGRGVWHSEERHGYRCHVCDASRVDHEVHHSCGHGGNHRYIRPGGGRPHRQRHFRKDYSLQVSRTQALINSDSDQQKLKQKKIFITENKLTVKIK